MNVLQGSKANHHTHTFMTALECDSLIHDCEDSESQGLQCLARHSGSQFPKLLQRLGGTIGPSLPSFSIRGPSEMHKYAQVVQMD